MAVRTDRDVVSVSDARDQLTATLRRFREAPGEATPVVFGSHRKAEAVIVPIAQLPALSSASPPAGRTEPASRGVRSTLHRLRPVIERLAQASRLTDVQVFGSVARGDDHPESDVDLLVTPGDEASLFDLARFELDVELLLERPVDVVSRHALDPVRDAPVLREAVPL